MTFEFLNFAQTVSLKMIRPPLQIHHGEQSKEKLEMWRNQFVHYGKQAIRLYALNFMNPRCKAKKKQTKKKKGSYLSSCWCWCCNRSYLCLWFRITEKEGEREGWKGKERGGASRAQRKRGSRRNQGEGEKVSVDQTGEIAREETAGIVVLSHCAALHWRGCAGSRRWYFSAKWHLPLS